MRSLLFILAGHPVLSARSRSNGADLQQNSKASSVGFQGNAHSESPRQTPCGKKLKSLNSKLKELTVRVEELESQNSKLKSENEDLQNKLQEFQQAASTSNAEGYVPDPTYEPFFKMKKTGVPLPAIKAKMAAAGLDPEKIEADKPPAKQVGAYVPEPAYEPFFKMKKLGVPLPVIKAKMAAAGLDPEKIEADRPPAKQAGASSDQQMPPATQVGPAGLADALKAQKSGLKNAPVLEKKPKSEEDASEHSSNPMIDELKGTLKRRKKPRKPLPAFEGDFKVEGIVNHEMPSWMREKPLKPLPAFEGDFKAEGIVNHEVPTMPWMHKKPRKVRMDDVSKNQKPPDSGAGDELAALLRKRRGDGV